MYDVLYLDASPPPKRFSAVTGGGDRDHFFSDAHAYMLISRPTATSMILGAFQAMLSSLL
jgi:hypothetical protein